MGKDTAKAQEFKDKGNKAFGEKKYKDAIAHYTQAVKFDDSDAAFYSNRSAAYMGVNDFTNALSDSDHTIRLKPNWVKGYYRRGIALQAMNKIDEAIAAYQQGLKVEPSNGDIPVKLAEVQKEKRKREHAAQASIKKGYDKDGRKLSAPEALRQEGNFAFKDGKYELALDYYTRALTEADNDTLKATLFANRAACHAALQQYAEVVTECDKCLNKDPNNLKALIRRGLAYESLEKWQKGLDDITGALRLDPQNKIAMEASGRLRKCLRANGVKGV